MATKRIDGLDLPNKVIQTDVNGNLFAGDLAISNAIDTSTGTVVTALPSGVSLPFRGFYNSRSSKVNVVSFTSGLIIGGTPFSGTTLVISIPKGAVETPVNSRIIAVYSIIPVSGTTTRVGKFEVADNGVNLDFTLDITPLIGITSSEFKIFGQVTYIS
jgi:hypothetical protein